MTGRVIRGKSLLTYLILKPLPMIGISWNLRGLNARVKKSSLRKLIKSHDPHFVFVQETKMETFSPKVIKSLWNDDNIEWLFSPSRGNSGGLLTMWKSDFFHLCSHNINLNWIALNGFFPAQNFNGAMINIYNPCDREERENIWDSISEFWHGINTPCLILGDFNEILHPLERGSQWHLQQGIYNFKEFIQKLQLTEIVASNGWFTWHRGRAKSKLDRLLVNPEWVSNFPALSVFVLKRGISDHCPLLIKENVNDWGPKPFRFYDMWLSHSGCMEIIKEVWIKNNSSSFGDKLKEAKKKLKEWNRLVFGNIDHQIHTLEERINVLDQCANERSLNDHEIEERQIAQSELWDWLKKKEAYWAQNSRSKWLKEGDKNTKYFHALASNRKRKNCITSLTTNGLIIDDPAGIQSEAVNFFKKIFHEDYSTRPIFEGLNFRTLSSDQAASLIAPFSRDEIDAAVDSCNSRKAPGPDGYNFHFIKSAWEVIKFDIYSIIDEFQASCRLPKGSNVAFIALVAKCNNPEGFKDFRPISMVGCVYKIISKLLARRLQGVMNSLIGPNQSSFIAGRQILDGALIAGELIETCQRLKIKSTVLKLDFHKAFDSVAWSYLDWTLSQMGFPQQWRAWIMACVTSAAASILINGSPTMPFKLHRGLRQGDPLSPFLFNLVVETLSLVIEKATNLGLWEGVETSRGGPKISHLQYADDTVIFCPPKVEFLLNIKKTLILFQLASGLQVNFHKSSIHGIHLDDSWLQSMAKTLLCKVGVFPMTYLGLPIGGNTSRIALWNPIIERIERKLASWKGKLLSIAGRLTLIKASIASLPLYYMSLFQAPKGVIEKINKLQRQFLWGGEGGKNAMSLAAWDKVVLPKILGGLNCGSLLHRNISLLCKWIWRFLNEQRALWRSVVQAKYGYHPSLLHHELSIPPRGGPWRSICAGILNHPVSCDLMKSKIRRTVGCGESILFWHEIWLGSSALKSRFPRLFSISQHPNATIASLGYWDGPSWHWALIWTREMRPQDKVEWAELRVDLEKICLSTTDKDSFAWSPIKTGAFSVKSFSFELAQSASLTQFPSSHSFNWKRLWKGLIPPRIEVFLWLALNRRINSKSKLVALKIIPPEENVCALCLSYEESSDHLLLHCDFSYKLWCWWLKIWGLSWVFPLSLMDAFEQWVIYDKNLFFKKIWLAMFSIIVWSLWKERNSRIFCGKASSSSQLQDLILTRLNWWIKGWNSPFPYSANEIIRNPRCLQWCAEITPSRKPSTVISSRDWSPPEVGYLKWNVDASLISSLSRSAIGGVLRDSNGVFKCVFSSPIPFIEINSAEILAIFRASQIAMTMESFKNHKLIIESDSSNAVMWCNAEHGGPWNLNYQLNFIRNVRRSWLNMEIIHKGRSSNIVADTLAKQGLTRADEFLAWL